MGKSRFTGAQPPPTGPVSTYHVIRCQKDGPVDVTILADTIFGTMTHHVFSDEGGFLRTVFCSQHEPGGCIHHAEDMQWCGWLPVWQHVLNRRAILRLAPKEADVLSALLGVDLKWAQRRVQIEPVNNGDGRTIEVAGLGTHPAWQPLKPHPMTKSICLIMKCAYIPRQAPVSEDDPSGEGVIPCE